MGVGAAGSGTSGRDRAKREGVGRSGTEGERSMGGLIFHFPIILVVSSFSPWRLSAVRRHAVDMGKHLDGRGMMSSR